MTERAARHLAQIARGGSLSIAGAGISALAGFAVVALITNQYPRQDAGALFSATSLFLVLVSLGGLGVEVGLGRFVPPLLVSGRWAAIEKCLKNTVLVSAGGSIFISAATWVSADSLAAAMALPPDLGGSVLRVLAMAIPPTTIGLWALAASRSFANIRHTVWVDKLFRSLAQLALVAWAATSASSLISLTVAWVVPSALLAPLALWGLVVLLRRRAARDPEEVPTAGIVAEFWSFTWPRSISQVSQVIIQRADIVIVGALLSPAAAAVYTVATRFVPLGQLGVQAVQQVIQPRFAHLLAIGDRQSLGEVFRTTTAWNMAMAWPLYLTIAGLPALYLGIFGPGFRDQGVGVVLVMAAAMMIGVASGPVDTLLLMSGRSGLSLLNSLVALVVDITLCFVLVPRIGIIGAAVAWCAAVSIRAALGYFQIRRQLGISPLSKPAAVVAAAALGCFGLPLGAVSATAGASLPVAGVVFGAGALTYAAVLWRNRRRLHLSALRAMLPGGRAAAGPPGTGVRRQPASLIAMDGKRGPLLFIGGFGRSGSTLLECLLARLESVVVLGELEHLWVRGVQANQLCACGQPFDGCEFWSEVGRIAFGGWDRVDVDRVLRLKSQVVRQRFLPRLLRRRLKGPMAAAAAEFAGYHRAICSAAREITGARVVVDSSKFPPLAIVLAHDPETDLRILHLVRDSRGVAFSWAKTVARPETVDQEAMPRYSAVRSSVHWLSHNLALELARRLGRPLRRLRYEDLVAEPAATVAAAWRELGLPGKGALPMLDNQTIELVATHSVAGNPMRFRRGTTALRSDDAWRDRMAEPGRSVVTVLCAPLLVRYGYRLSPGRAERGR